MPFLLSWVSLKSSYMYRIWMQTLCRHIAFYPRNVRLSVEKRVRVGAVICTTPCARSQLSFSKATNWIIKGALYTPISRLCWGEGGGWTAQLYPRKAAQNMVMHITSQQRANMCKVKEPCIIACRSLNKHCQGCCCTVARHCQMLNLILLIFLSCSHFLSHLHSLSACLSQNALRFYRDAVYHNSPVWAHHLRC